MIKKLVLLVSIALVAYFLYYGFQKMKLAQAPEVNLYSQVPNQSILILEFGSISRQWHDIQSNNIIWDELNQFKEVSLLEQHIQSLDSTLHSDVSKNQLEFPHILVSVVPTNSKQNSLLIQWKKESNISIDQYTDFISTSLQLKKINTESDSTFILHSDKVSFYGVASNGIISVSANEDIIHEIKTRTYTSIIDNVDFIRVQKTSSKDASNKVFMRPLILAQSIERLFSERIQLNLSTSPTPSSWVELDLNVKPDEISMGGFAFASDSLQHWLSIFQGQEAMPATVVDYLPNKTAFFIQFGFSDFKSVRSKMSALQSIRSGSDFDLPIHHWDSLYEISVQDNFLNWIDNEIALSLVEPEQSDIRSEGLVWINSSDSRTLQNSLTDIALKVDNTDTNEFHQIHYKDYVISKLNIHNFLETCLGQPFGIVKDNYFTRIEDFIVFSNSPATLQWCIDRYENEKILSASETYNNFTNRISSTANIFLYSDISKSPLIYKHLSSPELQLEIEKNLEFLHQFQGVSLQISFESNQLYYVNNYLKYNPSNKRMSNTLWETQLNSTSLFKPVILKNHYTNAKEVFVQDTSNTIYLIDSKGKILWNRKLDERILSKIKQIDVYKNDKLQMVFNTASHIYLIDRNGNNVSNFPVEIPNKTSIGMNVIDYDSEKNYRFIVPTNDGNIVNYTAKGISTKGWNYNNNDQIITHPISYVRVRNKDYLITVYSSGSIKCLDRRGNIRLDLKSKLNFNPKSDIHLIAGTSLDNTYLQLMTTNQDFVQISLNDQKELLFSVTQDSVEHVDFVNVDDESRKEFLIMDKHKLSALTVDGKPIFRFSVRQPISYTPNVYAFDEHKYIGYVSRQKNLIFLADQLGEMVSSFPLKGSSPFTITDINNDGRFNVITTDKEGVLLNYTID